MRPEQDPSVSFDHKLKCDELLVIKPNSSFKAIVISGSHEGSTKLTSLSENQNTNGFLVVDGKTLKFDLGAHTVALKLCGINEEGIAFYAHQRSFESWT